ncbi:MAG: DUF3080 family protein [Nevskiales bacterium]|nr:DUF3080 family protein [Nevskiales bacterium]
MKAACTTVAMLLALSLSGCADRGAGAMLADYRARVQRASGAEVRPPEVAPAPTYPTHRLRRVDVPEVRGSLWELLFDLPDCGLGHLVSERNSILGRYWPATQRLSYELRFAIGLRRCRAQFADSSDPDLRAWHARLLEIGAAKRGVLPAVWWAVTYDSPEFAAAFSPAAAPLAAEAPPSHGALSALEALLGLAPRWDDPRPLDDVRRLDGHLQQLAISERGGALIRSQQILIRELDAASLALEQAWAARLCPQAVPTPRARILHNVFLKFYAAQVQPYMALIQHEGTAWLQLHQRLLQTQAVTPPPDFRAFAGVALSREDGSLWARWNAARQRHVHAWQQVLQQCSLMPGSGNPPAAHGGAPARP